MDDPKLNGSAAETPGPVDQRRRRLGQAALGGGALALVFRAGSVRAGGCMAPSATMSAHPSANHDEYFCTGRSPGSWKSTWEEWEEDGKLIGVANDNGWSTPWPSPYKGTDKFVDVFGTPPLDVPDPNATLYDVLSMDQSSSSGDGLPNLAAYFVSALLNINAGDVPSQVMDERGLFEMYTLVYSNGGYYTPYAGGPTWGPEKVKLYLSLTWDGDGVDGDTAFAMLRGF